MGRASGRPVLILRNPSDDRYKDAQVLKEQIENNDVCKLEWCDETVTKKKGPGDKHLCRGHQIFQREYGNFGRLDRPWTFSKKWCCDWCGYSPKEDPWFESQNWDDEGHKNLAMRNTLTGDHIIRKTDGGSDGPSNVQTLCQNCDAKKTALNHDYRRKGADEVN